MAFYDDDMLCYLMLCCYECNFYNLNSLIRAVFGKTRAELTLQPLCSASCGRLAQYTAEPIYRTNGKNPKK